MGINYGKNKLNFNLVLEAELSRVDNALYSLLHAHMYEGFVWS